MKDKIFLNSYFQNITSLAIPDETTLNQLVECKNILLSSQKTRNKILIFGNGGSAAIASHFSVDITKNCGLRCINFNESDLITCFSIFNSFALLQKPPYIKLLRDAVLHVGEIMYLKKCFYLFFTT